MRLNLEPEQRTALVKSIFSQVVPHYDHLNHLLSAGRDAFWRRAAARRSVVLRTGRLLDLASGTGDQALALAEVHQDARIIGVDFTYPMLKQAQKKIIKAGLDRRIYPAAGDALRLPFKDCYFDSVTIAFGIRNIPDRLQALKEMRRVLTPQGRVLVLELTFPQWSAVRRFYGTYLNRLLPRLGGLISGQEAAYQYLADSIMDFPPPGDFCRLMTKAGFRQTSFLKLTFGIAVLHIGVK